MIRLVAVDMDGTLLDVDSTIPPETFGLIDELRDAGVRFVVSSGRRHDTLRAFWGVYADEIDYVASNGTQVVCDGRVLEDLTFDHDVVCRLKEFCDRISCAHLMLHGAEHRYVTELNWRPPFGPPPGEEGEYERNVSEVPDDEIFKIVIPVDRAEETTDIIFSLTSELGDELTFLPYSPDCIDVMPRGVSKASGLRTIGRRLKIRAEDMAAYGDSMNDYEMLRYVGHPFAMANACYVLRSFAERVLGTNAEHAVQAEMARIAAEAREARGR